MAHFERCPYCNEVVEIPEDIDTNRTFCTFCGKPFLHSGPVRGRPGERAARSCPHCNQLIADPGAFDCPNCGKSLEVDRALSTIIPYKNWAALIGYYCGVFSLIPCLGLVLVPFGILFGVVGIVLYLREPRRKGLLHAVAAIMLSLVSCGYHVLGIIYRDELGRYLDNLR